MALDEVKEDGRVDLFPLGNDFFEGFGGEGLEGGFLFWV